MLKPFLYLIELANKLWHSYPYRMIFGMVGIALGVMMWIYLSGSRTSDDVLGGPTQFGQFGDYIGGVLNPIFGFITICLLLEARKINYQQAKDARDELDLTRNEYNKQQIQEVLQAGLNEIEHTLNMNHRTPYKSLQDNASFSSLASIIGKENVHKVSYCEEFKELYVSGKMDNEYFLLSINYVHRKIDWVIALTIEVIERTETIVLKRYFYDQAAVTMNNCARIGAVSEEEKAKWFEDLKKAVSKPPANRCK